MNTEGVLIKNLWAFPGGHIESGQSPLRNCKERATGRNWIYSQRVEAVIV